MNYSGTWGEGGGGWIGDALAGFGLDSPSKGSSTVGGRAVKTIAANIHDRGIRFEGPNGRWPANADSTIKSKGFDAPNFVTGEMLSEDQIAGTVEVSHSEAKMTYGKDGECREKAHWAHVGQSSLEIKRPFMGLVPSDGEDVAKGIAADLNAYLSRG